MRKSYEHQKYRGDSSCLDFEFQSLLVRFWIPTPWIPDSGSKNVLDSKTRITLDEGTQEIDVHRSQIFILAAAKVRIYFHLGL